MPDKTVTLRFDVDANKGIDGAKRFERTVESSANGAAESLRTTQRGFDAAGRSAQGLGDASDRAAGKHQVLAQRFREVGSAAQSVHASLGQVGSALLSIGDGGEASFGQLLAAVRPVAEALIGILSQTELLGSAQRTLAGSLSAAGVAARGLAGAVAEGSVAGAATTFETAAGAVGKFGGAAVIAAAAGAGLGAKTAESSIEVAATMERATASTAALLEVAGAGIPRLIDGLSGLNQMALAASSSLGDAEHEVVLYSRQVDRLREIVRSGAPSDEFLGIGNDLRNLEEAEENLRTAKANVAKFGDEIDKISGEMSRLESTWTDAVRAAAASSTANVEDAAAKSTNAAASKSIAVASKEAASSERGLVAAEKGCALAAEEAAGAKTAAAAATKAAGSASSSAAASASGLAGALGVVAAVAAVVAAEVGAVAIATKMAFNEMRELDLQTVSLQRSLAFGASSSAEAKTAVLGMRDAWEDYRRSVQLATGFTSGEVLPVLQQMLRITGNLGDAERLTSFTAQLGRLLGDLGEARKIVGDIWAGKNRISEEELAQLGLQKKVTAEWLNQSAANRADAEALRLKVGDNKTNLVLAREIAEKVQQVEDAGIRDEYGKSVRALQPAFEELKRSFMPLAEAFKAIVVEYAPELAEGIMALASLIDRTLTDLVAKTNVLGMIINSIGASSAVPTGGASLFLTNKLVTWTGLGQSADAGKAEAEFVEREQKRVKALAEIKAALAGSYALPGGPLPTPKPQGKSDESSGSGGSSASTPLSPYEQILRDAQRLADSRAVLEVAPKFLEDTYDLMDRGAIGADRFGDRLSAATKAIESSGKALGMTDDEIAAFVKDAGGIQKAAAAFDFKFVKEIVEGGKDITSVYREFDEVRRLHEKGSISAAQYAEATNKLLEEAAKSARILGQEIRQDLVDAAWDVARKGVEDFAKSIEGAVADAAKLLDEERELDWLIHNQEQVREAGQQGISQIDELGVSARFKNNQAKAKSAFPQLPDAQQQRIAVDATNNQTKALTQFSVASKAAAAAAGQLAASFVKMALTGKISGKAVREAIGDMMADVATQMFTMSLEYLALGAMASTVWGAAILGPPAPYFAAAGVSAGAGGAALVAAKLLGTSEASVTDSGSASAGSSSTGTPVSQNPQTRALQISVSFDHAGFIQDRDGLIRDLNAAFNKADLEGSMPSSATA